MIAVLIMIDDNYLVISFMDKSGSSYFYSGHAGIEFRSEQRVL